MKDIDENVFKNREILKKHLQNKDYSHSMIDELYM
jgi:hypothetical protein